MSLEIRTSPALIGIKTTSGKQSIQQPKAEVEGSISLVNIRIEGTLAKVKIDQNQAFNESGLKDLKTFSSDYVNYAYQKMQESIGRIAEQGTQLSNIHLGGNTIADQAFYNAFDQFYNAFGMVTMPRTKPVITVEKGTLNIKVNEGKNTKRVIAKKVIASYERGKVEIYLRQKNSISIKYLGEKVDLKG